MNPVCRIHSPPTPCCKRKTSVPRRVPAPQLPRASLLRSECCAVARNISLPRISFREAPRVAEKLIVVTGSNRGVGVTTVALNLAVQLA